MHIEKSKQDKSWKSSPEATVNFECSSRNLKTPHRGTNSTVIIQLAKEKGLKEHSEIFKYHQDYYV